MLTFKDCLDYCGMTEDEVSVIAHHERMDGITAMAFAYRLLQTREGEREIYNILVDEMRHAQGSGSEAYVRGVLDEYLKSHPRCAA